MTGFGKGEYKDEGIRIIVESKTVNNKHCDFNIKMPRKLIFLEDRVRSFCKGYIKRGRVDIFVTVENIGTSKFEPYFDLEIARKYVTKLRSLRDEFNLIDDISAIKVATLPEVIISEPIEEDMELIWKKLLQALEIAMTNLLSMRKKEGEKLKSDIIKRTDTLNELIKEIKVYSYTVVEDYREKLQQRLKEITESVIEFDQNRIIQEVAIYADRSDITEEIVRFESHIVQLQDTLEQEGAIGRKLDFIIQEMNREINTIGSKSSNMNITNKVVDIKTELERIREQVQNIE
jgi:uncharacterized protein (TIGR00255 family)